MGAVPGGGFLREALPQGSSEDVAGWFDVEPFRHAGRRMVVRAVDRPVLVLGSTQHPDVVDQERARCLEVAVVRRRSGGGAVLLAPGEELWGDIWVPRGDPLWSDEPRRSAERVGEWWAAALGALGVGDLEVHRGGSLPAPGSDLVCFAGLGPGEVTAGGVKLVGLAQWRSREGALVHGCVYRRWDPRPLLELLAMDDNRRTALAVVLDRAAQGLDDLDGPSPAALARTLRGAVPDDHPWEVVTA